MQLTLKQFQILKLKVMNRLHCEPIVCVLDSNMQQAAFDLGNYEWIAGWGVEAQYTATEHRAALPDMHGFIEQTKDKWKLGYITYDLKNEIEELQSNCYDGLRWPKLHFFVPRHLIVVEVGLKVIQGQELVQAILDEHEVAEQHELPNIQIQHRVNKEQYIDHVGAIRQHIKDGDVYEMNYCIELYAESVQAQPEQLYQRLLEISPVPFASFYKCHHLSLMCASPERFLLKKNNQVFSQPIKGTAPRCENLLDDEEIKSKLRASEKERAENLMIVDLVRNDLAHSAQTGSVKVEELFGIYSFKQVHQMISTVSATLKPNTAIVEIIRNAFPMGSMTGAPKIKSMQLIEQYEATKRGLYSGSVGYISPNNDFDFNVVIRALQLNSNTGYLSMMVGSAITYDSVAEAEYDECLLKAKAMLHALLQN
jgi:para-aminobenzoate synthetase component 1